MEKVELLIAIKKFENALTKLEDAVNRVKDDLDRDGAIQRFEFTVELLWKTLKMVLAFNKVECFSPRDCVKKSFRFGIIEDDEIILDMLDDRNRSSHIYSEEVANEIFNRIKSVYVSSIRKILNSLKENL